MPMNPRDPAFQKLVLAGILLAGLLFADFFTSVVPFTYKACAMEAGALETKYRDLNKDLNKARQATHRLSYLEKEYLLLHRKWELSQSLLPEAQDMAWCLRTISLLGAQAGVQFTLFKPLPPKPAQYFTEHPIDITVQGGYHEVGAFLNELSNLDRVINISGLEVRTPKRNETDEPTEASFVAVTYVLGGTGRPPEEETAEAAPGRKTPPAGPPPKGKQPARAATGGGEGE